MYNCYNRRGDNMKVKIGVSARHVHLNKEDLENLFGANYELTEYKKLLQPGEFSALETVTIKTPNSSFNNVRVVGPIRNYTQVEISKSDSYILKINPPIEKSGELDEASEITIVGPVGEITKNCCIIPNRHIHINKEEKQKYGFENQETVSLKVDGEKSGVLSNVYLKESDNYIFECHLDLDDANAFLIKTGDEVDII